MSGGTQHRTSPHYHSEEMKILNIYYPRVRIKRPCATKAQTIYIIKVYIDIYNSMSYSTTLPIYQQ